MVQEVHLAEGAHLDHRGCLAWKDQKVQLGLMVLLVPPVPLVQMVLLEIVVFQGYLDQLDLLVQEELKVPREKEGMLDHLAKKDQLVLRDFKDHLDQLVQGDKEERKDLLANRELLALVEDLVTRVLQGLQEQWVHQVLLDCLDPREKLDLMDQQENGVSVEHLAPLELLGHLA